jgi:ubiquinone biosynthesis monooxygenase Coq7
MIHKDYLEQELRSDHAGEVGAVAIYQGMRFVAKLRGDQELLAFADSHSVTEIQHLEKISQLIPESQRSKLSPIWQVAGWLTGAVPALFGRTCVYATIDAVETFVTQHYQQQIDVLSEYVEHNNITDVLIKFQQDEQHHQQDAASRYFSINPVLGAYKQAIGAGSGIAVAICRRI